MNEILADVEDDIVSQAGEGIHPFFQAQLEAGEQHLERAVVPKVGDLAPEFSLPGTDGQVALADLIADGPAVLLFLRGHW